MYWALNEQLAAALVRGNPARTGNPLAAMAPELDAALRERRDEGRHALSVRAVVREVAATAEGAKAAGVKFVPGTAKVAVMPFRGVMAFEPELYEQVFYNVVATRALVGEVDRLDADAGVDATVFDMHSPGGECYGLSELDAAINRTRKPVVAMANRMIASAAYFQAAQADLIVAGPDSVVGSIGTMMSLVDLSKMFERMGVRFVHVGLGEHKTRGHFGAPISREDEEYYLQSCVPFYEQFVGAVARGRGLAPDKARALASGDTWIGPRAVELGLADVVGEMSLALAAAAALATARGVGKTDESKRNAGSATGRALAPTSRTGARPDGARASGAKGGPMDLTTLKAEHPELYGEVFALGKTEGLKAKDPGEPGEPKEAAATLGELETAFPGEANAAFVLGQLRAGSTMTQARGRHAEAKAAGELAALKGQVATLTGERDAAKAELEAATKRLAAAAKAGNPLGAVHEPPANSGGKAAPGSNDDQTRPGMAFRAVLKAKADEILLPVNHAGVFSAAKKADPAAYAEWETACRSDPSLRV